VEANLVRACCECHEGPLNSMPITQQLALVKINNPGAYDRMAVNLLRGRQPDAITEAEVNRAVRRIGRPRLERLKPLEM
jgi:hypothetical protein